MGFGNHIPFERKPPPDPTFGELRQDMRGFTIECRKCERRSFVSCKASRFLKDRLPDDMKLRTAAQMFCCSACNHNTVQLIPEGVWDKIYRTRAAAGLDDF